MSNRRGNNAWRLYLFVSDREILKDPTLRSLKGFVRPEENLIHLFPNGLLAPIGLPTVAKIMRGDKFDLKSAALQLRFRRGRLLAEGPLLGGTVPVTVLELHETYARTPFKPMHLERLANRKVAMVGLGSMGSAAAVQFAKAGVGSMILLDPDTLEIGNISRHQGDLLDVGRPKVTVVAERLTRINPRLELKLFQCNVFDWSVECLKKTFRDTSTFVATTDKGSVQLQVNDLALRMKIPAVLAGCYEEARGGEVFCTFPDSHAPCYACLRSGMPQPPRKGSIDYSRATGPEDYKGEPGLHSAINQVANVAVQAVLSILLKDQANCELGKLITPQRNYILVGTGGCSGFYRFRKPFDIFFQPLKGPRRGCPACQLAGESPMSKGALKYKTATRR